jgi:hypothetical protein
MPDSTRASDAPAACGCRQPLSPPPLHLGMRAVNALLHMTVLYSWCQLLLVLFANHSLLHWKRAYDVRGPKAGCG